MPSANQKFHGLHYKIQSVWGSTGHLSFRLLRRKSLSEYWNGRDSRGNSTSNRCPGALRKGNGVGYGKREKGREFNATMALRKSTDTGESVVVPALGLSFG